MLLIKILKYSTIKSLYSGLKLNYVHLVYCTDARGAWVLLCISNGAKHCREGGGGVGNR